MRHAAGNLEILIWFLLDMPSSKVQYLSVPCILIEYPSPRAAISH